MSNVFSVGFKCVEDELNEGDFQYHFSAGAEILSTQSPRIEHNAIGVRYIVMIVRARCTMTLL